MDSAVKQIQLTSAGLGITIANLSSIPCTVRVVNNTGSAVCLEWMSFDGLPEL